MEATLAVDKKKRMILVGLSAVLLVALVFRFAGGGATDASSAGGGLAFLGGRGSVLDSDPSHLRTVAKIATARARTIYAGWEARDPMEPLVAERRTRGTDSRPRDSGPAPIVLPAMTLSGVVWDPESAFAMIDGNALRVGDTIKGAKVVEIGIDRVALVYKSKRFILTVD
jgi:hypothetical protein